MITMTDVKRQSWIPAAALALTTLTAPVTAANAATGHHHTQAYHRAHALQARAQMRDPAADFYDMLAPPVPDYCPYNTCRR